MNWDKYPFLVLGVLAVAVLLPGLGRQPVVRQQELRVALVARDMVETGRVLVPHFQGQVRLRKPPLSYWLTALSFKLTGNTRSVVAARLPSVLTALGFLWLLYGFGRRLIGHRAALTAGLCCGSAPLFIRFGRLGETDMTLGFFILASLAAGWKALDASDAGVVKRGGLKKPGTSRRVPAEEQKDSRSGPLKEKSLSGSAQPGIYWLLSGAAAGAGFMTKGPAALVIPILVLGFAAWKVRVWRANRVSPFKLPASVARRSPVKSSISCQPSKRNPESPHAGGRHADQTEGAGPPAVRNDKPIIPYSPGRGLRGVLLWLIAFSIVGLPWYIFMLRYQAGNQAVASEMQALVHTAHQGNVFYYFYTLPLWLLPWSLCLLFVFSRIRQGDQNNMESQKTGSLPVARPEFCTTNPAGSRFVSIWFLVTFLLLTVTPSKQAHYSVLLLAPACLMLGKFLHCFSGVRWGTLLMGALSALWLLVLAPRVDSEYEIPRFLARCETDIAKAEALHVVGINSAIFEFYTGRPVHNIDSLPKAWTRARSGDAILLIDDQQHKAIQASPRREFTESNLYFGLWLKK